MSLPVPLREASECYCAFWRQPFPCPNSPAWLDLYAFVPIESISNFGRYFFYPTRQFVNRHVHLSLGVTGDLGHNNISLFVDSFPPNPIPQSLILSPRKDIMKRKWITHHVRQFPLKQTHLGDRDGKSALVEGHNVTKQFQQWQIFYTYHILLYVSISSKHFHYHKSNLESSIHKPCLV